MVVTILELIPVLGLNHESLYSSVTALQIKTPSL